MIVPFLPHELNSFTGIPSPLRFIKNDYLFYRCECGLQIVVPEVMNILYELIDASS